MVRRPSVAAVANPRGSGSPSWRRIGPAGESRHRWSCMSSSTSSARQGRVTADRLTELANHLADRDREIAMALYEHRILTSSQLTLLFFSGRRRAMDRLLFLYRVDRRQLPRRQRENWSTHPQLAHRLEINTFVTDLIAATLEALPVSGLESPDLADTLGRRWRKTDPDSGTRSRRSGHRHLMRRTGDDACLPLHPDLDG
ncbi:MAG TPA: hypothetical protein VE972_00190 [Conexibacter sp.]|nr:hypothetical protein [Conexibacter sp.]